MEETEKEKEQAPRSSLVASLSAAPPVDEDPAEDSEALM